MIVRNKSYRKMDNRNRNQPNKNNLPSKIKVLQRKKYNCFCKVFCCKCMYCCQSFDFSLLTSEHRKNIFHSMIKEYVKSIEDQPNIIIDPFFVLVGLLMGDHDSIISQATRYEITNNRHNRPMFSKEDLQLYIPQLCTYLVFHQEMQKIPIFDLLERTSRMDFHFALKYFLYMKSLQSINGNSKFNAVITFNEDFLIKIGQHFTHEEQELQENNFDQISRRYNRREMFSTEEIQPVQYRQQIFHTGYQSIFRQDAMLKANNSLSILKSTLSFLNDLTAVGEKIMVASNRKQALMELLQQINKQLPAQVFMPFRSTNGYLKVGGILFQESKVFNTKTRAPYYIGVQVYETNLQIVGESFKEIVSTTSLENQLQRSVLFEQDSFENMSSKVEYSEVEQHSFSNEHKKDNKWLNKIYNIAGKAKNLYSNRDLNKQEEQSIDQETNQIKQLFGESMYETQIRIKKRSPFRNLPKYQLLHLMVKTNDDLRQESFAMQLLKEFNTIFKIEGLPISVIPYEVIPLGHNCGVIEFLKDTITMDELRKKEGNLEFIRSNKKKRVKFMQTLVGYSLISYFLQVKDRHNGNILIKRDGSIINIDFGFFISNSPGKGVQLEKKVPFKITTEYIDTLGGLFSKDFAKFRKLFFKGYEACRKHQHRILILTKLMYSSHGTTMPCFQKGNQAIEAMEQRFNPTGIRTDGDLSLFCQDLINKSIDNWRAKWYDKWQYYFQGILY